MWRGSTTDRDAAGGPAILGIDNVPLGIVSAQVGSRVLAATIDYVLLVLLQITTMVLLLLGLRALGVSGTLIVVGQTISAFLLNWGFFAIQEIVLDGRTLGKNALGLRVVSRHGGKASNAALIVRNLIRAVDVLIGMPFLLADRRARRLGDMVAGTLVVHSRGSELREEDVLRLPAGWGARHAALLESFFARAELLEPGRAHRLADQLLEEIGKRDPEMLAQAGPVVDPVATLKRILGTGA